MDGDRAVPARPKRRRWPWIALTLWTAGIVWLYVQTVESNCSNSENDCGAAVGLGALMSIMIWLVGLAVVLLLLIVARAVRPTCGVCGRRHLRGADRCG